MPRSSPCAPARSHKVMVVGLVGKKFRALEAMLVGYPIVIRNVSPECLLRLHDITGLVVLTRFVSHKHTGHARRIARNSVVWIRHGAARSVFDAIIEHFCLRDDG